MFSRSFLCSLSAAVGSGLERGGAGTSWLAPHEFQGKTMGPGPGRSHRRGAAALRGERNPQDPYFSEGGEGPRKGPRRRPSLSAKQLTDIIFHKLCFSDGRNITKN